MIDVVKRDGSTEWWNPSKIASAVNRAVANNEHVDKAIDNAVKRIECSFTNRIDVETIQDIVEQELGANGNIETLRNFAHYRAERTKVRSLRNIISEIYQKHNATILNENGNIDGNTNCAQRDFIASEVCKNWALTQFLPKDIADAHVRGDIYIHDLGFSPAGGYVNCCLVNIKDMLENGFTMGTANISEPRSIRVATNVVGQIITAVSSQNYGGTTVDRIDEVLEPYVEKSYQTHLKNIRNDCEKLNVSVPEEKIIELAEQRTDKECEDSFQQLEYSINCSHNSHAQVPFVTLGFGLGASKWARMIQKWILNTRLKGLGKERKTAIFPKLVFALKRGLNLNPEDPNYDIKQLALKCSARRMYPDILSYDKVVEVTGGFKSPMGELSRLPM